MAAMTTFPPLGVAVTEPPMSPLPATFEELALLPDDLINVAVGAALIARDAHPSLELGGLIARFDEMAAPLVGAGLARLSGVAQADAVARHMFGFLGFRGNENDYYDPRNSLIPDVIERRLGIPITLALVYCEIARRAGVVARGVGFPGHFLVRVDAGGHEDTPVAVDPFFGGRRLDAEALQRLLERAAPSKVFSRGEHLVPVGARAMLVRMLINLKWVYATRGDFARALLALDRIICLTPDSVAALRERGTLAARLGAVEAARADFSRLLELAPDASDAGAIRSQLEDLRSKVGRLN
ncbi:MAG: transglutaminase-like domain-containing protein [Polyangiaceae bacterium]|jgi:regulator of sirC expression with transglutaminase-like and TPR domain